MWTEQKDGSVRIGQTIHVGRESQRKIVLGKRGATIKAIGAAARGDIGQPVHLFCPSQYAKVGATIRSAIGRWDWNSRHNRFWYACQQQRDGRTCGARREGLA